MVVKLFQQLVTESTNWVPATQPLLYSASWKPVIESPYLVHSTADLGVGRHQVSTNMASTDRLQSLLITRLVYRLYNRVFTKNWLQSDCCNNWLQSLPGTGYTALPHQNRFRVYPPSPFNYVDSGAGRCGSIYKELLQPIGYRVYRPGAGLHSPYFDSSLPVLCWLQRKLQFLQTKAS